MKVMDIYNILDSISPFELASKWDNCGLNLGDFNMECNNIYIALELDFKVLDSMENNSLLIVHHPLIFKPLQVIHTHIYPANLIAECIKKNIAIVAMHTNFDTTHLNNHFASKLKLDKLGFSIESSKEFSLIYKASKEVGLENLAKHIKDTLGLSALRYSKGSDTIKRAFITCGSNASSYNIANKDDCIITGDIKYHDAMIANSNGISFIDTPHFESECCFTRLLLEILQKHNIQAIIADSHNPFCYI